MHIYSGTYDPQVALDSHAVTDSRLDNDTILFHLRSSYLTSLFPDELVIQPLTITIIHHKLFISAKETLPIKDIGRVIYVDTPIFGGIDILGKNTAHELRIKGLYRDAAMKATKIIEDLMLMEQHEYSPVPNANSPEMMLGGQPIPEHPGSYTATSPQIHPPYYNFYPPHTDHNIDPLFDFDNNKHPNREPHW